MTTFRALISRWWPVIAAFVGVGAFILFSHFAPCTSATTSIPLEGSQGYRIWSGPTLNTFEHGNKKICIPEGWEALGAEREGDGWALFPRGVTGLLIKSDAFLSRSIESVGGAYTLTLRYPTSTLPSFVERYTTDATEVFGNADGLFTSSSKAPLPHTLLVTAELAGNTVDEGTRVFPDPGPQVTVLMRTPDHPRAQELLAHAALHAYNRHRPELRAHLPDQAPLSAEDFEELEATWAEFAYAGDTASRTALLQYLHEVHEAIRGDIPLPEGFYIKDAAERTALRQGLPLPTDASFTEEQYGHYVLAPLVMLGIEGLLAATGSDATVASLLTETHAEGGSFLDRVEGVVGPFGRAQVDSWLSGTMSVPYELAAEGVSLYSR